MEGNTAGPENGVSNRAVRRHLDDCERNRKSHRKDGDGAVTCGGSQVPQCVRRLASCRDDTNPIMRYHPDMIATLHQGCEQVSVKQRRKMKLEGKILNIFRTLNLYLSFVSLGLCLSVFGPTLLDLQRLVNTDTATISFIYVARSSGYIVGSLIGGIVFDCLNVEQPLLIISNFFMAFCIFIIPLCGNISTLLAVMATGGFFMGVLNTGSNVCCLNIWGKKGAPFFQGLHFCFGLGGFVGPLIAAPFLSSTQNEWGEIDIRRTVSSPTPGALNLSSRAQDHSSLDASTSDYLTNYVTAKVFSAEDFNITSYFSRIPSITYAYSIVSFYSLLVTLSILVVCIFSEKKKTTKAKNTDQVSNQGIIFTVVVVFLTSAQTCLIAGAELAYSQLLTSYVVRGPPKLSKVTGSYMTSVYWGSFTLTRAASIFVAYKISTVKLIIFDLIATVSASLVLLFLSSKSVLWLWIGSALLGIGVASFFPAAVSWMERYITVTNKIASIFTVVSSLGEMTVPMIIGKHIETFPDALFVFELSASCLCCCFFVTLYLILRRKNEKYSEGK